MKARYWSLAIVLILVNYLIFATLFSWLLETDFGASSITRTPVPTFTPAPAVQPTLFFIPTLTPVPVDPTPTATRVLSAPDAKPNESPSSEEINDQENSSLSAAQPSAGPQLVAPGAVNIRSGPSTNYPVIGALNANTTMLIVGRNPDASWWQIRITDGSLGWVANTVVSTQATEDVPMVDVPAPPPAAPAAAGPQPAADSSPPPAPEKPKYQYEPTGWYDDGNAGLTRFLGTITDISGNPVNGVFVQASCGDYSTISFPSGPVGWGPLNVSADWPAGFYDIVVDEKPVPCLWVLTVVDTDDRQTVKAVLSESIPVEITTAKSIVTANWRKNW